MNLLRPSEREFRNACGLFSTGVAVITGMLADGDPRGLTISSLTSVSLEPPIILFCIHNKSYLLECFRRQGPIGVNILAESQRDLADRFSDRRSEQFRGLRWRPGLLGAPLIDGTLSTLECVLRRSIEEGDHYILTADVATVTISAGPPIVRFAGKFVSLAFSEEIPALQNGLRRAPREIEEHYRQHSIQL